MPAQPDPPRPTMIVGNEEAFLRWFYDGEAGNPDVFDRDLVTEYLRPSPAPVVGIGGERGLGQQVSSMLRSVAENVTSMTVDGAGHIVPEEAPANWSAS